MIQRAAIERDPNVGEHDDPPAFEPYLADVPCRLWTTTGREALDPSHTATIEDLRLIVPRDTAVLTTDSVNGIFDRRGRPVDVRRLGIVSVLKREDHLELLLEIRG